MNHRRTRPEAEFVYCQGGARSFRNNRNSLAINRESFFRGRAALLALLIISAAALAWFVPIGQRANSAPATQSIIVEMAGLPPTVVAADEARRAGQSFDQAAHEQAIAQEQNAFLSKLQGEGIAYQITATPLNLANSLLNKPNRFSYLINAIGLEVPAAVVDKIERMAEVKHVTISEPMRPLLDNSIKYVRASDGPGNKTIFTQGGGPAKRYDGTGQVVAILDTGIEHTHPAFDTRFDDANYLQRTGDIRPVRLAGQPYLEGTNHPKVAYFLSLTATTNEDDVGHGTHAAADAAGLKVRGPGLDRLPGNADDQIIEGVAPGALLMNYKVCETIFTCVGTVNIVTALEDAVSPTDPVGNPKPVATVINMSFGGTAGNPNDASAVAASNAALAGAVSVSSAGNSGPGENTVGAPSVGRRVISVAATNDPGAATNSVDVLVKNDIRYSLAGISTGGQNDAGTATAPEDQFMKAILMGGAPDVQFPLGQHYVYVGFADTPDQVPDSVNGRIALASRGSTVDAGASGTGLFGHKAAEAAAKGAIALLIFNNVDGELEAATTQAAVIPVYGMSKANGEYLRDMLGFQSGTFNKDNPATWGTISNFPIRINPSDPSTFSAATTGFSSRGPADNFQYLKPDVTAPGQSIYAATIPAGGLHPTAASTMSDPSRYISVSGTSFSGPTVAGAAALVRQALLDARGQLPVAEAALRSGAGAAQQQTQNNVVPQSIVRAALTNTATNLRTADGETQVSNTDQRTFIHEIGSGLIHVIAAVDSRAAMGTNDLNGAGGPDDANDPNFLPTHSFGQNNVIGTGNQNQQVSITVTLQNVSGASGGGGYTLSLLDGGANRGDVTRPIVGTQGFSVGLSTGAVNLGAAQDSTTTFDVTVTVDGRATEGLQIAGTDDTGASATEFLWWVVASGANGEVLRMPFYYRATQGDAAGQRDAPFQNAIQDDATPDQENGVDRDGNYKLSWTFPEPPSEQPCGFRIEEATTFGSAFSDDGNEPLVAGTNSKWSGDPRWISVTHPGTGTMGYGTVYLDSQDISLTMVGTVAIPAGASANLMFDSYEDIEDDFDFAFVEVSADGGAFIPLAQYTGFFSGKREVDLSGFAGKSVKVRFRFVTDLLVSAPLFLGWFIDNIEIQMASFSTIGTVDGSTFEFNVTNRPTGTYFYRIAGLFGDQCDEVGPYSNIRQITVDRNGMPQPVAPTADFTASPNPAMVNEQVTFDGSASTDNDDVGCNRGTDPNKCITSYFWSFGDGTQTTGGPVTMHSYSSPGTYRATLTVTDNDGQTDQAEMLIEVTENGGVFVDKVTGGGWIPASGDRGNFGFNAQRKLPNKLSGNLTYDDKGSKVRVSATSITSLKINGNRATITGNCTVNKQSGFTFTVDVVDNDETGLSDFFQIGLSNGYGASGTIGGGNIKIHK